MFQDLYGYFHWDHFGLWVTGTVLTITILGYTAAPLWLWSALLFTAMVGFGVPIPILYGALVVGAVFNLRFLRKLFVSAVMLKVIRALKLVPKISDTEKAALDAGSVWVEADFFSGKPNFKKLMGQTYPQLTPEEQAYVDGPIEKLCEMIDDWKIYQNKEIPEDVWDYMREIKIFGMIIPKSYGGLEFSALAHSAVIMKLASRSIPVTITAMVPNSLGPAELLNHYGTDEQKNFYLPRLAAGEEIPCFALTEQRAGSDAGSIESEGVVFKKEDGKLYVRLNWNKRWITLAAISTVLGLAFRLKDPDKLLGDDEDVGITCALIPSDTNGVIIGRRHDPLSVPFYNCPTQGKSVEIPVDWIIGGVENAGKGWTMLMESLGAGRGVSLPAQAAGGSKVVARVTSAHTSIRKQFGLQLYKLEGLEEPLARIAGYNYILEAMRCYTCSALDQGIKPSVITAIAKQSSTEIGRTVINDGMDIMAGSGISRGPRNVIANIYLATPIGVTVEGANILTRTLIIFGQGLFRAHPWAYKEVDSIQSNDLDGFDRAIWGHVGHVVSNVFRTILLSVTRGRIAFTGGGPLRRYYQKISWASAAFALLTDVAMGALGGGLKLREKLTGRFADILSWLYMSTAVIRRWEAEGRKKEDLPFVHFSLRLAFTEIQKGFEGILANLPVPGMSWFFKYVLGTWSKMNQLEFGFSDHIGTLASRALIEPGAARDRLTQGMFIPQDRKQAIGRLEYAYNVIKASEEAERKIQRAIKKRNLPKQRTYKNVAEALEKGVISQEEARCLNEAADARWDACQVDDFSEEAYHGVEGSDIKAFRSEYKGPAGSPAWFRKKAKKRIA